mmetsp:Transcript_16232/g.30310  ORF Transcript_16232/g.30310 Transcript_16232/m.30310 type:complete len:340 (+) Transcript_16232:129-1148(+)
MVRSSGWCSQSICQNPGGQTQVQLSEFNDRFKWRSEMFDREHKSSSKSNSLIGQWKNETLLFARPGNAARKPDPLASSLTLAHAKDKEAKMITSARGRPSSRPRSQQTASMSWKDMRKTLSAPSFTGVEVALVRNGQAAPGATLGPPPSSVDAEDFGATTTARARAEASLATGRQVAHTWGGGSHLSTTKGSALLRDAMEMTQMSSKMSSTWASNDSRGDGRLTNRSSSATMGRTQDMASTVGSGFRHPKDRWFPHITAGRGTVKMNVNRAIELKVDPGKEWGLECPMWDAHQCRITHAKGLEHVNLRTPKKAMRWRSQEHWEEAAHRPVFKVNHIAPR